MEIPDQRKVSLSRESMLNQPLSVHNRCSVSRSQSTISAHFVLTLLSTSTVDLLYTTTVLLLCVLLCGMCVVWDSQCVMSCFAVCVECVLSVGAAAFEVLLEAHLPAAPVWDADDKQFVGFLEIQAQHPHASISAKDNTPHASTCAKDSMPMSQIVHRTAPTCRNSCVVEAVQQVVLILGLLWCF